jgi:hypothetical protein
MVATNRRRGGALQHRSASLAGTANGKKAVEILSC